MRAGRRAQGAVSPKLVRPCGGGARGSGGSPERPAAEQQHHHHQGAVPGSAPAAPPPALQTFSNFPTRSVHELFSSARSNQRSPNPSASPELPAPGPPRSGAARPSRSLAQPRTRAPRPAPRRAPTPPRALGPEQRPCRRRGRGPAGRPPSLPRSQPRLAPRRDCQDAPPPRPRALGTPPGHTWAHVPPGPGGARMGRR